jgi:hypothetical protein
MPRCRSTASLVSILAAIAILGGCSNDDTLVSTDSPVPVVVPGTSSAQCTAPTGTCVLAASDVSADTGVAISSAAPGAATDGSVMAASQGVCDYGNDGAGTSAGSGATFTVTFYCGLTEEASTAYVDGYKDQVTDGTATLIAGLGDYAVWIPSGSSGSVAALEGNAYVTVVFDDSTGATSPDVAQASAAAVTKGYLAALF